MWETDQQPTNFHRALSSAGPNSFNKQTWQMTGTKPSSSRLLPPRQALYFNFRQRSAPNCADCPLKSLKPLRRADGDKQRSNGASLSSFVASTQGMHGQQQLKLQTGCKGASPETEELIQDRIMAKAHAAAKQR